MMMMTEDQYIVNRVNPQIEWHNEKSNCNKRYYIICSWILIAGSILTGVMIHICQEIGVMLSAIVAITASMSKVYRFHSKWRLYRLTSEILKHEKVLFETKTGIYNNNNAYSNFVTNIEAILMKTNEDWEKLLEDLTQKNDDTDSSQNFD